MPSFRSLLVSAAILGAASAAHAQSFGNLAMRMDLRQKVGNNFEAFNSEQLREFFNRRSCQCGRSFFVEMQLISPPAFLGDVNVEIWTGVDCSDLTNREERNGRCQKIDDQRTLGMFRDFQRIEISAKALMFPNVACTEGSGDSTVWAMVNEGSDNDYEYVFKVDPAISWDSRQPSAVSNAKGEGVEDAIKVSWTPPTGTAEIDAYQVYCALADGAPIFTEPPAGPELEEIAGCPVFIPAPRADADAGVADAGATDADAGADDAGTGKPQSGGSLETLDPAFVCGDRIGPGRSFRIGLGGDNVQPIGPDDMIKVRLVVFDRARNIQVVDMTSGPPSPVRDGWEHYHDAGGTADGGFCFVATAVYGDYDHPYVRVLRALRDGTLAKFGAGRAFIRWYYEISPPLAEWLRRHDVARALAAAALFPVVALAWVWNLVGGAGVLALVLLFWAARRRRRHALGVATAALLLAATVAPAAAQVVTDDEVFDEPSGPPRSHWAVEIKLGPYMPDVDGEEGLTGTPYRDTYGGRRLYFGLELDYFFFHPLGQLGLAATAGHTVASGNAFKQDPNTGMSTGERSADKTTFRLFPLALSVVYRFTELSDRTVIPLVPYAKLGLSYYIWQITKGDGEVSSFMDAGKGRGGTLGWQGSVGLAIRADRFDPEASRNLTTELGVEHAGFFFELTYADVSGLIQDNKLHVGDLTWTAGVNFEF